MIPGEGIVLAPECFAPTAHYMALAEAGLAVTEADRRYNKREKAMHRFDIADVRGRLTLTIPVSFPGTEPGAPLRWADMRISAHGRWWATHFGTLRSAYGRAPYFDVLEHVIGPFFDKEWVGHSIVEYNISAQTALRQAFGIQTPMSASVPLNFEGRTEVPAQITAPVYPQIREGELGFIPGLSILDYLANCGPTLPKIEK